jgi:hypothetical protein
VVINAFPCRAGATCSERDRNSRAFVIQGWMAFNNFLNSNPLVDSATSDDERPTPGHVYSELISM